MTSTGRQGVGTERPAPSKATVSGGSEISSRGTGWPVTSMATLEAQRLLAHTDLPIGQVSDRLGFTG